MAETAGSTWMAETAGRYQTVVTWLAPSGKAVQQVLTQNPRRWYVEFGSKGGAATMKRVVPGPLGTPTPTFGDVAYPQIWKFRDCPSLVTGDFYSDGVSADGWLITEVVFVD